MFLALLHVSVHLHHLQGVLSFTLKLLKFCRWYFISQQLLREHYNQLILLSCNFNNFETSEKHKFKTFPFVKFYDYQMMAV
jgi:hypothetical protein